MENLDYSWRTWDELVLRIEIMFQDNECKFCKMTKNLTIDHIVPLSKGGARTKDNLQILCTTCNSKKGNSTSEN